MIRTPVLLATAAMLVGGVLLAGQIIASDGPLPSTPEPITVTPASHQHQSGPASPPATKRCVTDERGHDGPDGESDDGTHQDCDSYGMETVGPTPQVLSEDHSGHGSDHSHSGDSGEGGGRR